VINEEGGTIMFKNILVPTDFSTKSKHALEIAMNIALLSYGTIHLHLFSSPSDQVKNPSIDGSIYCLFAIY